MVKARNRTVDSASSNKSKRSVNLRKYEVAYNKCIKLGLKSKRCKKMIKKLEPQLIPRKSVRKPRKRSRKHTHTVDRRNKHLLSSIEKSKRPLNAYQKFVKRESSKSVYKGKNAKSRLRAISRLWRRRSSSKSRN